MLGCRMKMLKLIHGLPSGISDFRGKGYGHKIVSLLIEKIRDDMPDIKTVCARVKPGNEASRNVFDNEGFNMKEVVYELDLNSPE